MSEAEVVFLLFKIKLIACQNSDFRVAYLPRNVNIIRYIKGSRNTACGHNDFCSVRLNGPI